jgi:hypothetical protein
LDSSDRPRGWRPHPALFHQPASSAPAAGLGVAAAEAEGVRNLSRARTPVPRGLPTLSA